MELLLEWVIFSLLKQSKSGFISLYLTRNLSTTSHKHTYKRHTTPYLLAQRAAHSCIDTHINIHAYTVVRTRPLALLIALIKREIYLPVEALYGLLWYIYLRSPLRLFLDPLENPSILSDIILTPPPLLFILLLLLPPPSPLSLRTWPLSVFTRARRY